MYSAAADTLFKYIDSRIHQYPVVEEWIQKVQELTGIRSRYFIVGLPLLALLVFCMPVFMHLLTLAYPLYMSVSAIEKGKEGRTRWLIYWLLFHSIHVAEFLTGWILTYVMGGGFTIVKFVFLLWCMAPLPQNGCFISYSLIRPFVLMFIGTAEEYLSVNFSGTFGDVLKEGEQMANGVKEAAINGAISYAVQQHKND